MSRTACSLLAIACLLAGFVVGADACTPSENATARRAIILACEDVAPLAERVLAARAADAGTPKE